MANEALRYGLFFVIIAIIFYTVMFGVPFIGDNGGNDNVTVVERPVNPVNYSTNLTGYERLYKEINSSIVTVHAGSFSSDSSRSQGSGFVYDSEGHIVTNNHVINTYNDYYIKYSGGEWVEAEVIGTDERTDLAVLEPNRTFSYVEPIPVSQRLPNRGSRAIAIGSPDNLENSLTEGVVSGLNRTMESETGHVIPDTIQSDATLSVGSSGGPLVNMRGEVIGVNRAKQGDTVSLAISPRIVNTVVPRLIEDGDISHPFVGLRMRDLNPEIIDRNDYISGSRGVIVVGTVGGGPADDVLQPASGDVPSGGDVIVSLDGTTVRDTEHFSSLLMLNYNPGDEVDVTVNRRGELQNVTITLGAQRS